MTYDTLTESVHCWVPMPFVLPVCILPYADASRKETDKLLVCVLTFCIMMCQDTVKAKPTEAAEMRKATSIATLVTTIFYLGIAVVGYAAFGDSAPGNLLTGFGFFNPYWLIDLANVFIMIHLLGAYQV